MTGKYVKDFKGALGDFYARIYADVTRNPRPVVTVHRLGSFKERPMWERVVLHMSNNGVFSALFVVNRVLDLDHDFKIVAARSRTSGLIALQFVRADNGTIIDALIVGANKVARETTGRRLDELINLSIRDTFPAVVSYGFWEDYVQVSLTGSEIRRVINCNADGVSGQFNTVIAPYRDGVMIDFIVV
jgi:hypothetical protein